MTSRIEQYAMIGYTQTAALVGDDGSIDWWCAPRFDSGACFAALLGDEDHGRWLRLAGQIEPYMRKQLADYASGKRKNEIMEPIAQALKDDEKASTAAYYAHLRAPATPPAAPEQIATPAGTATLGRRVGFGWDNEFAEHAVEVPAFAIDKNKVTNEHYLEFLRAGGYSDRALWSASDWQWKEANDVEHPEFWIRRDGDWVFRTMFGERPLPLDWPVFVSHAEASAYAGWAGKALPTEAEFQRAAFGTPSGDERAYPWGDTPPTSAHGAFDFSAWDPEPEAEAPAAPASPPNTVPAPPANALPPNATAWGPPQSAVQPQSAWTAPPASAAPVNPTRTSPGRAGTSERFIAQLHQTSVGKGGQQPEQRQGFA